RGELAPAGIAERDRALAEGEQRVVAALSHAVTGVDAGAALAHDDGARGDGFAAVGLHTESFGVGIAAVPGRAAALLVCHKTSRVAAGLSRRPRRPQPRPWTLQPQVRRPW